MKRRLQIFAGFLTLTAVLLMVAASILTQSVPTNEPVSSGGEASFPELTGTNLLLEKITVPTGLAGELKLIVVAYDSDQQVYVDQWLLPLEELNQTYPSMAGYYVPLLPQDTADAALPIIGGMTLAAKNDQDRARTIVVFTDVTAFNTLVNVPDVAEIALFLLDSTGNIQWQGRGGYSPETLAELETALTQLE